MSDGKPLTEFEFISLNKDYNKKIRQVLSSKEQLEGQSQMMLAFEIEVRSSSCFSRFVLWFDWRDACAERDPRTSQGKGQLRRS